MNGKPKEHPIIFSSEMIRAILDNKKTQTRRPIKPQPELDVCRGWWWRGKCYGIVASLYGNKFSVAKLIQDMRTACPYQIGDILWVKETWFEDPYRPGEREWVTYKADGDSPDYEVNAELGIIATGRWSSPIFMPKWASRIKLEIINIRVERIQDISSKDVCAEGFAPWGDKYLRFADLWDSIWTKKGFGWDQNPWVNVIEFRRIKENEDQN